MERSTASETRSRRCSPSLTSRFIEDAQSNKVLVKDHNYFRDRTWNNSYLASDKIYSFYHQKENKLHKKQAELKEERRAQEAMARQTLFEIKALANRQAALASLEKVAKHRVELQRDSHQPVLDKHFGGIARLAESACDARPPKRLSCTSTPFTDKRNSGWGGKTVTGAMAEAGPTAGKLDGLFETKGSVQMLTLMNHKPSLLWNKITRLNTKNLDLVLTPAVVKADRQAYIHYQQRKKAVEEERELLAKRKQWVHDHIRFKGKTRPLDEYSGKKEVREQKYNRFVAHDEPEVNGLLMNDVLRIKGAVPNRVVTKLLRTNSLLRTLKTEDCQALLLATEDVKEVTSPGQQETLAPLSSLPDPQEEADDYFRINDAQCDFKGFEENLKKGRQFKEAKYPRINLGGNNRLP